jgi:two-component system, cell cycle response regulator DivK
VPASILVIEDNEDNITLIDYLLRARGYAPRLARSGAHGIRIVAEERFELILLDVRMPWIDGHEVAAAIKRQTGLERAPLVAVTDSAMVGDRERIAAAEFHGYIQKPIDPRTFIGEVEQFLPEVAAERDAAAGGP